MFDVNQLYSFTLPMTVASAPHNNSRDMSGMGLRDARLVQVIHRGISNWLLRPFGKDSAPAPRPCSGALVRSYCVDRSRSTCLPWKRTLLIRSDSTSKDFNQRIRVHDHLANLVLQSLHQHHLTLTPSAQEADMLKKYNDLHRARELLQAQFSVSQRTSPSSTLPSPKDDAELVTPPPTNHSQSSTPTSSLPTVGAAALDGRSFDGPSQQQPRIIQSLHGLSSPPSKSSSPQLLTMHSTSSRLPLLLLWHRWSSGPITCPVSTATSPWSLWRPSSCRLVNVCQKVMHLLLRPWPLCGDWNPATRPNSRTKRCASSSWRPD